MNGQPQKHKQPQKQQQKQKQAGAIAQPSSKSPQSAVRPTSQSGKLSVPQKAKHPQGSSKDAAGRSTPAAAASASHPTLLSSLSSPESTFAALLGPSVSIADFFRTYFERQPLHISRDGVGKEGRNFYKGLFSKAMFDTYLRSHADELKYGFNLNICVCSDEGKKIDMNPKLEGEAEEEGSDDQAGDEEMEPADDDEMEAEKSEEDEEAAHSIPAPPSKKQKTSTGAAAFKKRSATHPQAEDEEVETMTIAQALALAESQRAKLKPSAAAAAEEEEDEDEEDQEADVSDEEDAGDAGSELDGDAEDVANAGEGEEDEEQLDGTSVSSIRKYAPVKFADYEQLYAEGCTIQALQPQQYNEASWRLLAQLESLFGGLAGANVYITPPNSQGLAPHYDDVEVFVLQLEGEKTWTLYEPEKNLPRAHSGDFARDELPEPLRVVTVRPGDLLYLPRGVIHEARTSATMSSHMTVSVYQKTSWTDFLAQLFPIALEAAFESSDFDAFRRGLPVQYLNYMGSRYGMEREVEEGAAEALGISEEQARKRSGRHDAQKQAVWGGRSIEQLQTAFRDTVETLLDQLRPIMLESLDEAADVMSRDFMQSRLPPPPPPSASAAASSSASSAAGQYTEEQGPPPVDTNVSIRIRHRDCVRMIVVPGEDDSDDEEEEEQEEEEDGEGQSEEELAAEQSRRGHLLLVHSQSNSHAHHLDGRFPPPPEEERQLTLPLYYAPALLQLLSSPEGKFVRIGNLKLDFGERAGGESASGEDPSRRASQLELANALWLAGIVQSRAAPQPAAGAVEAAKSTTSSGKKAIKGQPQAQKSPSSNGKSDPSTPGSLHLKRKAHP